MEGPEGDNLGSAASTLNDSGLSELAIVPGGKSLGEGSLNMSQLHRHLHPDVMEVYMTNNPELN